MCRNFNSSIPQSPINKGHLVFTIFVDFRGRRELELAPTGKSRESEFPPTEELNDPALNLGSYTPSIGLCHRTNQVYVSWVLSPLHFGVDGANTNYRLVNLIVCSATARSHCSWLLPNLRSHTPSDSANRNGAESIWFMPMDQNGAPSGVMNHQRPSCFSTV